MKKLVITNEGYFYIMDWGRPKICKCGAMNNIEMVNNCVKCGKPTPTSTKQKAK